MADDRMKNDQRNMGAGGRDDDQNIGQQSPGRSGQDQQAGKHGQQGQPGQQGQFGGQNMEDDDEFATGGQGQKGGGQGRGGQNR